jgi:hypothetical protein
MKRATLFLSMVLAGVSMGTMAGEDKKSFDQIDQDGDKNLSQQELQQAGVNVQVQQYDQDNDGVLSQDEYKQAKQAMKKQGQKQQ